MCVGPLLNVYISPSSQESNPVCTRSDVLHDYAPNEEAQMWHFAKYYLMPELQASAARFGRVVLATESLKDLPEPQDYVGCGQEATSLQSTTPGDWVYVSLHTDAGDDTPSHCRVETHVMIKGIYDPNKPGSPKLAEVLCKSLMKVASWQNSSCQDTTGAHYYETRAGATTIPSVILELGFHDSVADTVWFDANRQQIATAIVSALAGELNVWSLLPMFHYVAWHLFHCHWE